MQNKGLIRLFAILLGLVCVYHLSFSYFSNKTEEEAKSYAVSKFPNDVVAQDQAQKRYLDSIQSIPGFMGITYKDSKRQELKKGLDLKGGINVILQISVKDILKGLTNQTTNPVFNKAITLTDEIQKDSQETYLNDFFNAFQQTADKDISLKDSDIFGNKNFAEDFSSFSLDQVKQSIQEKVDASVVSAFEVLRNRIDQFGVTQPNIQRLGNSGRILVELPGAKDVDRVKNLLGSTAQLEFWEVYKMSEFNDYLHQVNQKLKEELAKEQKVSEKSNSNTQNTSSENQDEDLDALLEDAKSNVDEQVAQNNPLFDLVISMRTYPQGPVIALVDKKNQQKFDAYIQKFRKLLPKDKRYARFFWGKPQQEEDGLVTVPLYAIKGNRSHTPKLSGNVITDARQSFDPSGNVTVSMQMNSQGARVWERMTEKAFQNQSQIAIVLDDIVYSAPGVTSGKISGGQSSISGDFKIEEGKDLANILRAGKLPASADIIQSEVVGPSLGKEAIDSGMFSFVVALLLILVWMIFYYGRAGAFADVALLLNILFIFGALVSLGAVLTLPGIAGIVLTIGMSVDANVLIFERIKEELNKGKLEAEAIQDGFQNALSSILDANITTALTGVILFLFGTGPIKGFATTLLIGILTSLFCAIFITRLFIDSYGKNGKSLSFTTKTTQNWFKNMNVDFLRKRKLAYLLSATVITLGLASLFTQGLDQSVDFVGGRTYTVRLDKPVTPAAVIPALEKQFKSVQVKTSGLDNQLKITTKYKVDQTGVEVDKEISHKLFDALKSYLPQDMTYDTFMNGSLAKKIGLLQSIKVGPTIADDIKKAAFWSILGSLVVVFLYILVRFRKWQFSLGAVVAVFHDTLLVLGLFSLLWKFMPFSMEIDQAFIAAILTVIGYSLNDTVVVFDRIREFLFINADKDQKDQVSLDFTVDRALNSTLGRTVNTSLTTLLVLIAIFIFAVPLRGFMFSLIIGVIVGTYSSLFIATPVMYDTAVRFGLDLKKDEYDPELEEVTTRTVKA